MLLFFLICVFCAAPAAGSEVGSEAAAPAAGSDEAVREAAEEALRSRFPESAARLQVRVVRTGGDIEGAERLRVRFPANDALPRAHTQIRLLDGSDSRDIGWAMIYVAHFDSVAVARSDVRPHDPVDAGQVEFAWMETTTFRGEPLRPEVFRELDDSGGAFATNRLRQGRAVRRTDVRLAHTVQTGEPVLMTYSRNNIQMRLSCTAREPGAVGDLIRLYHTDTKTTFRARISGTGSADWTETL